MFRFLARLFGRQSKDQRGPVHPPPPATLMGLHEDQPKDAKEHEMRKRYPSFANTLVAKVSGRWRRRRD